MKLCWLAEISLGDIRTLLSSGESRPFEGQSLHVVPMIPGLRQASTRSFVNQGGRITLLVSRTGALSIPIIAGVESKLYPEEFRHGMLVDKEV